MKQHKKLLFTILFSAVILGTANANVKPQQTTNSNLSLFNPNINKTIDNTFATTELPKIDTNLYAPNPFFIQGKFETNWKKSNFWNGNDNGGVAVGPFQIHSKYMLSPFFSYLKKNAPEYYNLLETKGGISAIKENNPEMKEFFCTLCDTDEKFINLQCDFINKNNFQPRLAILKSRYGLDLSSRSPAIEGVFRAMVGNINTRTYTVVENMLKTIAKRTYNTTKITPTMIERIIKDNYINTISDNQFVNIMQEAIHQTINTKIQKKFRNQLNSAYDYIITNAVRPNLNKPILTPEIKQKLTNQNKQIMATQIVTNITKELNILAPKEIVDSLSNQIANDQSQDYLISKSQIREYITKQQLSSFSISKNFNKTQTPIKDKNISNKNRTKTTETLLYAKKEETIITEDKTNNKPDNKKHTPPTKKKSPARKPKVITVKEVIENYNKTPHRPSLLRKAQMIKMAQILESSQKFL